MLGGATSYSSHAFSNKRCPVHTLMSKNAKRFVVSVVSLLALSDNSR